MKSKNKDKNSEKDIIATNDTSPTSPGLVTFEDLDRWFDDVLSRRWLRPSDWMLQDFPERELITLDELPKVNIIDHDDEIEIQAALPGVKKDNLDISINHQMVTIRASTRQEENKKTKHYYQQEIKQGEFQRSFSLPSAVDGDKAKATFKDGMLTITLPKLEKSKRKNIEIK
jgi:HSP20 family protein